MGQLFPYICCCNEISATRAGRPVLLAATLPAVTLLFHCFECVATQTASDSATCARQLASKVVVKIIVALLARCQLLTTLLSVINNRWFHSHFVTSLNMYFLILHTPILCCILPSICSNNFCCEVLLHCISCCITMITAERNNMVQQYLQQSVVALHVFGCMQ